MSVTNENTVIREVSYSPTINSWPESIETNWVYV